LGRNRPGSGAASARQVLPSTRLAAFYGFLVSLSGIGILGYQLTFEKQELDWVPVLLFSVISLLVQRSSFHLGSHVVYNLSGIINVGAVLTLGPVGGALAAVLSGVTYRELNAVCQRKLSRRHLIEIPLFGAGLEALMALLGGIAYLYLGGPVPMSRLDWQTALALTALCLVWFVLGCLGWAIWDLLSGGWAQLRRLGKDAFPQALLFGLLPLPFGVIVALAYTRLGWGAFGLLALAIVAVAFLVQRWANARNELGQRSAELTALEQVGLTIARVTATLEPDELFSCVAQLVRDSFDYYHVSLYTVDRDREAVTFQASSSAGGQDVVIDVEWGQGFVGWVAVHGRAVTANDVETDPRYRRSDSMDETRAELTVPMLLDGELVGVLDVQSDRGDVFGPDDLLILETLGAQISGAIQGARLYEAERQQAWLSHALLQVADAMSRVSDMDAVLTSIVRLTPILAGVDRCVVLLWDAGTETFMPAQSHGLTPELREAFDRMAFAAGSLPAFDRVRLDRRPLLVNASRDQKLFPLSLAETLDIQEVVILPLLAQGELVGVMMVDYAGKPHHFGEQVIEMLTGISNQAAMVIRSARLVEAQREEAYVSMALLQVVESVSQSTDLGETLETVARITPMLVGVESCALFLWDRARPALVPFRQYGLRGDDRSAFWQLRLTERDSLVRELAEGSPFVDVQALEEPSELISALARSSLVALPLVARGETLGMMAVDYAGSARPFAQRWTNILSGIAGQAALAVESDRLLKEVAEQERMRQELDVAQRIQASFLPESCPNVEGWDLVAFWRSARQVGGDFYDFIPLPSPVGVEGSEPGRIGLVVADVADKGVPAALFMALSRTLVRTMAIDGRPPDVAIARANDLIVADARSDLFVTLFYAVLQADSGEIAYVNGGHVPPLVARAADGMAEELRVPGMALGILPKVQYNAQTTYLQKGDTLVLYTDGITDTLAPDQQMFGLERLKRIVSVNRQQSARGLAETIMGAVTDFAGETAQFDDLTLVIAKRKA
jgi:serine phosphatase RsbU (regulator of sigma subunit)/putative methionine-R-sulfoxide reductase with GAF domain